MLDTLELVKQLPEMFVSYSHWRADKEWEIREGITPTGIEIVSLRDKKKIFHSEQEMRVYCDMMKWQIIDPYQLRIIRDRNQKANCTVA